MRCVSSKALPWEPIGSAITRANHLNESAFKLESQTSAVGEVVGLRQIDKAVFPQHLVAKVDPGEPCICSESSKRTWPDRLFSDADNLGSAD